MNRGRQRFDIHPRTLDSTSALAGGLRLFAGLSVAYVLVLSWVDPALQWPVAFSSGTPWLLAFLNVLPILIVNALFLVVTRRIVLSCWLTTLLLAALYFVNHVKMQELATPLLPDDFQFLKALGVHYSFFSQYLATWRLQVAIAVLVLAVTLLLSRERAVSKLRGVLRGVAALILVAIATTLVRGGTPWTSIYNPGRLQFEPWAPLESAARTGLIANMLLFHWELRGGTTPDLTKAKSLLQARTVDRHSAQVPTTGESMPDIIIVQSESLFDPTRLHGIDHDALPRLREARTRAWHGDLYVPTFGGGTIRTEFEVLTGLPLAAFPHVRYPYLQLRLDNAPSLVRELASHGYRTLAVHPNGGAFWNRNHAFRALGFDRFIDAGGFHDAQRHGWYVSDEALVDKVIEELQPEGDPQLIVAISIQNHGPYTGIPLEDATQVSLDRASLDAQARESIRNYLSMLEATDAAMARLLDFAQSRERHTLVLFYGDHLPPLNAVYAQLGFRDERTPQEQPVPWLLFDNRSDDSRVQDHTAWSLPTVLFERAGLPRSAYFTMLDTLGREARMACSCFGADESVTALAQLQYWGGLDGLIGGEAAPGTEPQG